MWFSLKLTNHKFTFTYLHVSKSYLSIMFTRAAKKSDTCFATRSDSSRADRDFIRLIQSVDLN